MLASFSSETNMQLSAAGAAAEGATHLIESEQQQQHEHLAEQHTSLEACQDDSSFQLLEPESAHATTAAAAAAAAVANDSIESTTGKAAGTAAQATQTAGDSRTLDLSTSSSSLPSSEAASEPSSEPFRFPGGVYYFYNELHDHPVPVQLPPAGATTEPPEHQPAFVKSKYRSPAFLKEFPVDPSAGSYYNFLSFLGSAEWCGGKYMVPTNRLEDFLLAYWRMAIHKKRKMHIAETYQDQPFK